MNYDIEREGLILTDSYVRFSELHTQRNGAEYQYDIGFVVFVSETAAKVDLKDCVTRFSINVTVPALENNKIVDNPAKWAYEELKKLDKFITATDA